MPQITFLRGGTPRDPSFVLPPSRRITLWWSTERLRVVTGRKESPLDHGGWHKTTRRWGKERRNDPISIMFIIYSISSGRGFGSDSAGKDLWGKWNVYRIGRRGLLNASIKFPSNPSKMKAWLLWSARGRWEVKLIEKLITHLYRRREKESGAVNRAAKFYQIKTKVKAKLPYILIISLVVSDRIDFECKIKFSQKRIFRSFSVPPGNNTVRKEKRVPLIPYSLYYSLPSSL